MAQPKPTALYALSRSWFERIFSPSARAHIGRRCAVQGPPEQADKPFLLAHAGQAAIIVTGWGTAPLDADVVAAAPHLQLLVHSAGSIKHLVCDALWERGIRVTSAAPVLAEGVAEFCLGLILTASKRVFWLAERARHGGWRDDLNAFGDAFEIHGQNVGIVAASHVGRHLMRLLRPCGCRLVLYDPYCPRERAAAWGARKVATLDELFTQCPVVALCAPATAETQGMIRGRHFALLPHGALFINAARGAIVHEGEMIEELRKGRFIACLDVTWPEPPAADSELRHLPNVLLTPHIAGAIAQNLWRQGDFAAREISAFLRDRPLAGEVRREQLARIA
jgi:phosphoglycerate dehydrogenase-like enzyme